MSKRRVLIIVLFLGIAAFAISRTLLLIQSVLEGQGTDGGLREPLSRYAERLLELGATVLLRITSTQ